MKTRLALKEKSQVTNLAFQTNITQIRMIRTIEYKLTTFLGLAFLAFTLSGCFNEEETKFYVEPQLSAYYDAFIASAKARGVVIVEDNLIVKVKSNLLEEYGGYGAYYKDASTGQRYVWIDQNWFTKREGKVVTTVYHELGHCYLNRKHNSGWSLMNSKVSQSENGFPDCIDQSACQEFLIDELFNNRNN